MNKSVAISTKRAIDLTVSASALALTLPIQAAVAAVIRMRLGSPVLFTQVRPGQGGVPFTLIKFRTMLIDDPKKPMEDGARLTRLGRWLRASSLDELPTFLNVLRGDMSLVGPRPLLMQYLPIYNLQQARRHEMRPGITGLAQVSGRNDLAWPERLTLDVDYVDRWSLALDAQILILTVGKVLRREGVTAAGQATVQPFTGVESL